MALLISQLILLPLFAICGWGYWWLTRERRRRWLDTAVVGAAAVASVLIAATLFAAIGTDAGIWPHVLAPMSSYGGFMLVLVFGFVARRRRVRA